MSLEVECILSIGLNTAIVLNIILILQLLFGLNLCKRKSRYVAIGIAFIIMDVTIALLLEEQVWVQTVLIYVYMVVAAFLLSKGNIIRLAFVTVTAVLLDIQWTNILDLICRILGFDYMVVMEVRSSRLYIFWQILFYLHCYFVFLFFVRKRRNAYSLKWEKQCFCASFVFSHQ